MPIRRLNFTDRQRIFRDDVEIVLRSNGEQATFDARVDLGQYGFPADARVFVEAYRQTTLARFDFGTVSVPRPPANRSLEYFDTPVEVLFRVRVTAAAGRTGMLLGEADRIRPRTPGEEPDRRIPLLPVVPEDLGEELWRVDFGSSATLLAVNNQLPDWKETSRSPEFRALVFPAAMRQILERILWRENVRTIDDSQDWRSLWLKFATQLPGSQPVPANGDGDDEWIEDAVAAFARNMRLRTRYQETEQG